MCTLIFRVGPRPIVAANRDEVYARPFSPPRRWIAPTPFFAPRDEEEGGTWIGVNDTGLVAAITNRSRERKRNGRASRGHLVTGALARPGLDEAAAWLEGELARAPRNPCQLLLLQGERAFWWVVDGDAFEKASPSLGFHVLSNLHDPDEIDFALRGTETLDDLAPILADRTPRLPRGFPVNKDAGWRGTVCSTLIEPGVSFRFADGPPDRCAFEPVAGYPA